MLQPTSVSAAVTTSLVKHVSYVSTAKNEPGYDIYADKVQQSFYRTGCMLDKKRMPPSGNQADRKVDYIE
ncbi:hypothetical protein [Paenibacillus polymyxa]|uniref:hypothetical protein n=1 Tax=Paenibacillus polymyxa TaxID=1406 RepID=UPI0003D36F1A|nr:hypothetical protein [Paenibacillus polymyxa]AHC22739.1 hypothetical protein X809_09435 [Paenibacillus polymyxa CR1]OMF82289.1 hypothetical protein BK145_02265 [Paenibacillus peoriae]